MKYRIVCEHCGHKETAYSHALNVGLIDGLGQLVEHWKLNAKAVNLQKDLNLTKNQYNNFQKLQYFGLVENVKGGWKPTNYGIRFWEGKAPCYTHSATLGKNTLSIMHPAWQTVKELPKYIMIWEFDSQYRYKQREEYQEEKGHTQNKLFNF